MLTATLGSRGCFIRAGDPADVPTAKALPGAVHTAKMPAMTWLCPLTIDVARALHTYKVGCSPELAPTVRKLLDADAYANSMRTFEGAPEPIAPIPVKSGVKLFAHQVKAFNIASALLDACGACAMLLDMGLGKSLITISVLGRLALDGKIRRALVVAPSSVCTSWPGELQRFAGYRYSAGLLLGDRSKRLKALRRLETSDGLQIAIVNYESTWRLEKELGEFAPDMIVCDESQRIKSHKAQQAKALHKLGDKAHYKMILTGTPIQNDTRDLWSQYRFLAPEIFGGNYYSFEKRYATMGGYGMHQYLGARNLPELTEKAHSIAYRATKSECLDLPEKIFETRRVLLEDSAASLYMRLKKEAIAELETGETVTANLVLVKLLRLQQLTGGFVTDDDGEVRQVSTAKLDAVKDILEALCVGEGKKLVVLARFRAELQAICEVARKLLGDNSVVRIAGDVPSEQRGEMVRRFQEDPGVMVFAGQLEAVAEGLTLTAADTMVFYSTSFNAAKYAQAQDRIHRVGQRNTCHYITLTVPRSVDETVQKALDRKLDIAKSVVDNWRDLIGGDDG